MRGFIIGGNIACIIVVLAVYSPITLISVAVLAGIYFLEKESE